MRFTFLKKLTIGLSLATILLGLTPNLSSAPRLALSAAPSLTASIFHIERAQAAGTSSTSKTGDSNPDSQTITDDLPIIPAPEFLPAPKQTGKAADLQNYLLGVSIPKAINIGTGLLALATFISFVIAAVQMLTALGEESQYERAKNNLKYSLMGFLFVVFAYSIVSIIVSVALPTASDNQASLFNLASTTPHSSSWTSAWIPRASALNIDETTNMLLPSTNDFIGNQTNVRNVNLPSGNFLSEILPAIFTNILYLVSFAIFISLVYGGALIVMNRGNEDEVGKAKTILLNCAYAIAVLSLGYGLIYGIATLNLNQDSSTTKDNTFTEIQK